jgi:XTP/dITP diphosphohydrolase
MRVVLATANPGKQREFAALLEPRGFELVLQSALGIASIPETGLQATDEENNSALLRALEDVPDERRTARYRCVLALLRNAAEVQPLIAQGSWEGRIARQRSGTGGFGYDSCFIPAGFECTAAELSPARKNALSHRGAALRELVVRLDSWR